MSKQHRWRAIVELVVAAALWGFGFVAIKWILTVLDVREVLFLRFAIASCLGLPFVLQARNKHSIVHKFKLSFWPAVFLLGTILFATWALKFTTPTKCGFITTLYVVFVPILEAILARRPIPLAIWICVVVALFGTGLIVDIGVSTVNIGDVLTLFSALLATVQIYWMGSVSPRVQLAFVFNVYQCFWCALAIAPFLNWGEFVGKLAGAMTWSPQVWLGLVLLSVGATVIAFYLQVRAQAELSRTVSSLMFLLESPFAMIFSILLIGEKLGFREALGALLIFAAAFAAVLLESRLQLQPKS